MKISPVPILLTTLTATEALQVKPKANKPLASAAATAALTFALAAPCQAVDGSIFNNEYADPFHPFCGRKIEVDGAVFHYSGTAVGPPGDDALRGCSAVEVKEFGLRKGAFDGKIIADNRISAGDGIHEGVWEPAGSVTKGMEFEDVDGIRWNDGNKWIVKDQSRVKRVGDSWVVVRKGVETKVAEGIFYAYIGFSTLAGAKGLFDAIQRKKLEEQA